MARYHYVLTVQHPRPDGIEIGTHSNYAYFDGMTEKQMYDKIYDQIGENVGARGSMAVLFYRLVPDPES